MASFSSFFPEDVEETTVGSNLEPGQLTLFTGEIYAFIGTARVAVANDVTANPTDWSKLSNDAASGGGAAVNPTTNTLPVNGGTAFVDSFISQAPGSAIVISTFTSGVVSTDIATSTVTITDTATPTVIAGDTVVFTTDFQVASGGFFPPPPIFDSAATGIVTDVTGNVITIVTTPAPNTSQPLGGVLGDPTIIGGSATISRAGTASVTIGGDATITGTTTLGIISTTPVSTGTAIGVDTTGEVITIAAGGGGTTTDANGIVSIGGSAGGTAPVVVTPPMVVTETTCVGGTDFTGVIESGSNGSGGYRFYTTGPQIVQSGNDLATTAIGSVEFASETFGANPVDESPIQTAILTAGGFASGTLTPGSVSVRNAPADFTAFQVSFTQTTPNAASVIVLVSSIVQNGENIFIGGTGASGTGGGGFNNPTARLFQASDFSVSTGLYRRQSEGALADWNLPCTLSTSGNIPATIDINGGTIINPSLRVMGVTTTTPGGSISETVPFAGLATATQAGIGYRLTPFGSDGTANGNPSLATFIRDNNVAIGTDIFITGTGASNGVGTHRFAGFPFGANLNRIDFDGYAADGLPTEAGDLFVNNPAIANLGRIAFQDEITAGSSQTVSVTTAAVTTVMGGNLVVDGSITVGSTVLTEAQLISLIALI